MLHTFKEGEILLGGISMMLLTCLLAELVVNMDIDLLFPLPQAGYSFFFLIDVWRALNSMERNYTYIFSRHSTYSRSVLLSIPTIPNNPSSLEIGHFLHSNHNWVFCALSNGTQSTSTLHWKFNNHLLPNAKLRSKNTLHLITWMIFHSFSYWLPWSPWLEDL